jgi:hypothetical protein
LLSTAPYQRRHPHPRQSQSLGLYRDLRLSRMMVVAGQDITTSEWIENLIRLSIIFRFPALP